MPAMDGSKQGFHETIDYRGEEVLQAYQKVDGFSWYVIADQDMAEILNRINGLGRERRLAEGGGHRLHRVTGRGNAPQT